jgi:hypothetical protein
MKDDLSKFWMSTALTPIAQHSFSQQLSDGNTLWIEKAGTIPLKRLPPPEEREKTEGHGRGFNEILIAPFLRF